MTATGSDDRDNHEGDDDGDDYGDNDANADDEPDRSIRPLEQKAQGAGPNVCWAPSVLPSALPDHGHDDDDDGDHHGDHQHLYHLQNIWSYVAVRVSL